LLKHAVQPGDIVAASLGEDAPRACLVPSWLGPAIVKADCIRIRSRGGIDAAFLMWMLNSPPVRSRAALSIRGVGRPRLGLGGMRQLAIPLPPLNEQRRIVAAIEEQFSRLDAADELMQRAALRLKALQRTVFSRTVSAGESRSAGELLEYIEAGKSFRCHSRPADDEEWGVIKVSAMTWGSFDERENKAVLSPAVADPRWEIKSGDLLLSRANTTEYVGASVLVNQCRPRLLLSDKSMRLITKSDIVDKAWLHFALSAPESRAQMSAIATGTSDSMRNISQEKVMGIRLKVPPLHEQQRIVGEIEQQLSLVGALDRAIEAARQRSASLRRSILERAFCGELVTQDPLDEPAPVLLKRIAVERATAEGANGRRPRPRATMERS
jgi:type I restriction enzyme, S subunit